MIVRQKQNKFPIVLSSEHVEKFIKSQINLSEPTPKLWLNDPSKGNGKTDLVGDWLRDLELSHPLLRKLDSCRPSLQQFNQVHAQLVVAGLFQHPLASSRVVKKLCSSEYTLAHSVKIFDYFEAPDAFLCNTIIRSYVKHNMPEEALSFYAGQMVKRRVSENNYTFPVLVKACTEMGSLSVGEKIYTRIVKCGFELDLYVRNALIRMYSICGRIWDARKVFDLSSDLDLVTLNSMIDGYVKNGEVGFARWIFDTMHVKDVCSWNSIISGYAMTGDMEAAKGLFEEMPSRDLVSWNCLIEGYGRTGDLSAARALFNTMECRSLGTWNTMLAAYVRNKNFKECVTLFDAMILAGDIQPNQATLMSVLTACAHLRRLDKGEWVHSYISNTMRIRPDLLLSTALLTMYAKCGALEKARCVFDQMAERSIISWNSMIMAYGVLGQGAKALELFLEMRSNGVMPNDATFTCLLSACQKAGMVLEGWWFFILMLRKYNMEPKAEHCGCMIDLLGGVGLTRDSEELKQKMPQGEGSVLWAALHSACRTRSHVELGEVIAKELIELEPRDLRPYVMLSYTYAEQGRWDDLECVRQNMKLREKDKIAQPLSLEASRSNFGTYPGHHLAHNRHMVYCMLNEIGTQMKMSCRSSQEK